ncbi:hypothetical protein HMPREF9104_01345 [Lentilactobacillus kisonensis F0435]|uniref:Uncharacterized protein n=1 Tax=Lentilactobacillus kisonensis F0435 TaxID=797516 RepID=H1LFG9_9LACO|nr:hypothetical protein HMPREF9104_01345 [Lentilactobacillus kisonensis F0435]
MQAFALRSDPNLCKKRTEHRQFISKFIKQNNSNQPSKKTQTTYLTICRVGLFVASTNFEIELSPINCLRNYFCHDFLQLS